MARANIRALADRLDEVGALPASIASKIEVDDAGCWQWVGSYVPKGYGQVWFDGSMRLAHRVVYVILVGPVPKGLGLDHLCRNRACVNPSHLEPVTQRENVLRGLSSYALRNLCKSGRHDISDPANIYTAPSTGVRQCLPCRNETNLSAGRQLRSREDI